MLAQDHRGPRLRPSRLTGGPPQSNERPLASPTQAHWRPTGGPLAQSNPGPLEDHWHSPFRTTGPVRPKPLEATVCYCSSVNSETTSLSHVNSNIGHV